MNVTITITVPVGAAAPDLATAITSDVATSPTGDAPPAIPDGADPPEPADLIGTAFVPPTVGDETERPIATETFEDDGAEPPSLAELGLAESAPAEVVEPPPVEQIAATEASAADAAPPAIHEVNASDVSEEGPPDLDIAAFDSDLPDVAPDEEPPSIDELEPPAEKRKVPAKRAAGRSSKK